MKKSNRPLKYIDLAEATWESGSPISSIPSPLEEMVLLAVERICGRNNIGMHGAAGEVAEIEAAVTRTLRSVGKILEWAKEEDGFNEEAFLQGRIYEVILNCIFPGYLGQPEDDEILEGLMLFQLDRLVGAYRKENLEAVMHIYTDICAMKELTARVDLSYLNAQSINRIKSDEARDRAKLRHQHTNELRAKAVEEWDTRGGEFSSMSAFARHRHKAYDVTERSLYNWIRHHQGNKR